MKKVIKTTLLSIIAILISSCSRVTTSNDIPLAYMGYSADYIYAEAHTQMQDEDYYDAIQSYKSLNAQYPFTPEAEKGTVELIYVYYDNSEAEMALALANQFIKTYPYSDHKGYVYYMIGVVGFEDGRGILQTYTPYDMSHHDYTGYLDAYKNFERAIKLNPKGAFVKDAKRRMVYINNIIAKYYLNISVFNFKRGAYNGAIDRAQEVVKKYPNSASVEEALVIMAQSYEKLGLTIQHDDTIRVLEENFPDSEYVYRVNNGYPWYSKIFDWL